MKINKLDSKNIWTCLECRGVLLWEGITVDCSVCFPEQGTRRCSRLIKWRGKKYIRRFSVISLALIYDADKALLHFSLFAAALGMQYVTCKLFINSAFKFHSLFFLFKRSVCKQTERSCSPFVESWAKKLTERHYHAYALLALSGIFV